MADATAEQPKDAPDAEKPKDAEPEDPQKALNKKTVKYFKTRLETAKRQKRGMTNEWKRNIDLRMGRESAQLYTSGIDVGQDEESEINPDWSLTKTKTSNLYSQVPSVQITHENKQYAPIIAPFARALNYELGEKRANVGICMREVLNDVVNAAGVGFVYVNYEARFEQVEMPLDPQAIQLEQTNPDLYKQGVEAGLIKTKTIDQPTDYKFVAKRISPGDGLWPAEFTGSNFDDADWVGYSGRMSWAEAKVEFKLDDEEKDKVLGSIETPTQEDLRVDTDKAALADIRQVGFDMLFYWRYKVDPDCKNFHEIWRLVVIKGKEDPIHEPWKGQEYDPQSRKYIGAIKFPIRVLTLTYITDNPIPPLLTAPWAGHRSTTFDAAARRCSRIGMREYALFAGSTSTWSTR